MARNFFGIEKGLDTYAENGSLLHRYFSGTAVPTGAGEQADAPIGSLYIRSGTKEIYHKVLNNGNSGDWRLFGAQLSFRPEKVKAVTSENIAPGVRDLTASPFSDDDGTKLSSSDFNEGEFVIVNCLGVAVLLEITNISGDEITLSTPSVAPTLAEFDCFVTVNYLPDSPDDQEKQALVQINSSGNTVKIGDVNWNLANGITLNGYSDSTGDVIGTDTVQVATQKMEKGIKDLVTLSGVARNSLVLGAFTSPASLLLSASLSIKSAFQRVGELLAQLRGVEVINVTTETTVDEVIVDDVRSCKWLITAFEQATPSNVQSFEMTAVHNGTSSSDATTTDHSKSSIIRVGSNFNIVTLIDLNGTGATQTMRLRASSSTAGLTVTARRIEVRKNTL